MFKKRKLWTNSNKKLLGLYRLKAYKAPAPSNIIWENLEMTKFERFGRQILSIFFVCCCLILGFGIIIGIQQLMKLISDSNENDECSQINLFVVFISHYDECSQNGWERVGKNILVLVVSIIVSMINFFV